jgi:hypothetical protein
MCCIFDIKDDISPFYRYIKDKHNVKSINFKKIRCKITTRKIIDHIIEIDYNRR